VPPFQGTAGVGHDDTVTHGVGGFLNPVDLGPEPVLGAQVVVVQAVKGVEQVPPQADTLGRFVGGAGIGQPAVQLAGLGEGPPQVAQQPGQQPEQGLAENKADGGGGDQEQDDQA